MEEKKLPKDVTVYKPHHNLQPSKTSWSMGIGQRKAIY